MARHGDGLYKRGKSWYLDCRINGVRVQERLGKDISRSVAKELANVTRTRFLRGEAGIGKRLKDCTFEKAKIEFLKHTQTDKRPRTYKSYQECLMRLEQSFAGKRLNSITTWLIKRHHQDRTISGARVRANREVAVLKNLFNFIIRMGLYEGTNPTMGIKLPREPKQKDRYLEPDEEQRLIQELQEPLRTLVIIGIHTGLRIHSEGLSLQWEHIDFKRNLLSVEAAFAKNGERRVIPLNSVARKALHALKATATSAYIFTKNGIPYRGIGKSFTRACARAKIYRVTPHTLRHTFASRLVMNGVDLRTVQELGGWKTIEMVLRYAHLSPNHKLKAVEGLVPKNPTSVTQNFTTGFTTPALVVGGERV
jgi:integrase